MEGYALVSVLLVAVMYAPLGALLFVGEECALLSRLVVMRTGQCLLLNALQVEICTQRTQLSALLEAEVSALLSGLLF